MTDRHINFRPCQVRAALDGRLSQTRRIIKKQAAMDALATFGPTFLCLPGNRDLLPVNVVPGDLLWVREAHALVPSSAYRQSDGVVQATNPDDPDRAAVYREGWDRCAPRWRPSIHMPRWASRLTLRVTDVRVQRVQDISEADAVAEGVRRFGSEWSVEKGNGHGAGSNTAAGCFRLLWNSIHGPDAWAANPWVCALTFDVIRANVDEVQG